MSRKALQNALSGSLRVSQPRFRPACAWKRGTRWQSTLERTWSTPLAKTLTEAITTTGPISIASYMRQCLTSDLGGYYTRDQDGTVDQFGKTGDFVTSPEISQIFGELVGIWFYIEWMSQSQRLESGTADPTDIIEFGPGRGTLMSDILRAIARFPHMAATVRRIYLVEASPALRETQAKLLCSKELQKREDGSYFAMCKLLRDCEVVWVEDAEFLPGEDPKRRRFVIAHEFFDALPIHAFRSVAVTERQRQNDTGETSAVESQPTAVDEMKPENQWRELLVNPTAPPSPFDKTSNSSEGPRPEFELVQSPGPSHHSRLLPAVSDRYKVLLPTEGATIEISPAARTIMAQISRLIRPQTSSSQMGGASGAALVIDYGPFEAVPTNSLRGIRAHKQVSPFAEAGRTDVSVDVDFGSLVEAALEASPSVTVHGPVQQSDWLHAMGGSERLEQLMQRAETDEMREALRMGWERLVDLGPDGMGKLYKCLAVVPFLSERKRRPVGFGGDFNEGT